MRLSEELAAQGGKLCSVAVVVPLPMSEVICICIQLLQKHSMSLMRSLMRLSPWTSDQGQGLSRIMKSLISSRSTGRFSLLRGTDAYGIRYYPPLHSCALQHRQYNSRGNKTETWQINDRKYRFVLADTAENFYFIV